MCVWCLAQPAEVVCGVADSGQRVRGVVASTAGRGRRVPRCAWCGGQHSRQGAACA